MTKKDGQSRFLEAPLIRQTDGEHKNIAKNSVRQLWNQPSIKVRMNIRGTARARTFVYIIRMQHLGMNHCSGS